MNRLPVYHVDAFTSEAFAGNPAGVIPDATTLTVQQMQKIANELNLPESAFLIPSSHPDADFRIRYFSPTTEIPFCGHATVASTWILATEYGWLEKAERIVFETNVGLIPVSLETKGGRLEQVTMTQISPSAREIDVNPTDVARLVGIQPQDLDDRYPMKLASTGSMHLLVPVRTQQAIDQAQPILAELAELNSKHSITTTHLVTWDAPEGYTMYTRDPGSGQGSCHDRGTASSRMTKGGDRLGDREVRSVHSGEDGPVFAEIVHASAATEHQSSK